MATTRRPPDPKLEEERRKFEQQKQEFEILMGKNPGEKSRNIENVRKYFWNMLEVSLSYLKNAVDTSVEDRGLDYGLNRELVEHYKYLIGWIFDNEGITFEEQERKRIAELLSSISFSSLKGIYILERPPTKISISTSREYCQLYTWAEEKLSTLVGIDYTAIC